MKHLLIFLILCISILVGGCIPAAASLEPSTVTPEILPRLDPSPTPSGSTLPLTCQVTDLQVYINEMDGYCFAYPMRFTLGGQPSDNRSVQGPAVDESSDPVHATLTVEFGNAIPDKTLREQAELYLKDFSVVDPTAFTWRDVNVGGESGWMVEPVPAMLAFRIVFVEHNGILYRLLYWPVDIPEAKADLDELTQTTLGSFAFTK